MSATKQKPRYRSPSICVDADVSLSEFSDEQIRQEFAHRFTGTEEIVSREIDEDAEPLLVSGEDLRRIRALLLCKQTDSAVSAMQDLIRDTLGTAL